MEAKMLSRAGKYSTEKFAVLKKKDEILSNDLKKFVVKSGFNLPKKTPVDDFLERVKLIQNKQVQEIQPLKPPVLSPKGKHKSKKKKPRQAPVIEPGKWSTFRAISRGTYYKVNSVRDPPPPFGYYNINYDLVTKAIKVRSMAEKKSSSRKVESSLDTPLRDTKLVQKLKGIFKVYNLSNIRKWFEPLKHNLIVNYRVL